jgi:hypothetical protein
MADEGEEILEKAVLWLQKQQEELRDGFSIKFKDKEYTFLVDYIDRQVESNSYGLGSIPGMSCLESVITRGT